MPSKAKFHYGYVIVACCCLIMGIDIGLVMSCAGVFYKPVSSDLGVSVGDFGLYMTFIYALSFLMLSLAGRMMEKFSARWLLTVSSGILGIVYISMSTFRAVWQFYAAGTLIGMALAFLLYLSYPVLINRWFKVRVGFFIGLCSAASGVGGVLFNPLAGRLIAEYGWRNTYLIFGVVILLIVTPLLALLLRSNPQDMGLAPFGSDHQQNGGMPTGIPFQQATKTPVFYLLLMFAFFMISVSTLNLFLPSYITNSGYSVQQSALVASLVMLGVTIGKVALGWINDTSPLRGVLTSTGLGILGFVFLLNGQSNFAFMLVGAFLFGWAYAGVTVETALLVRSVFGSKDYARIFSIISIALAAGGAVMAGGWGYLADFIDFKSILIAGIGSLVISALIGLYALFNRKMYL